MKIKKVAILGSGVMGRQIAILSAKNGYKTVCYDIDANHLENAKLFSEEWFAKEIKKERITLEESQVAIENLTFSDDIKMAGMDTDLIIEAVADILEVKKSVLKSIDEFTPNHAVYASNSSYIVSSKFADSVKNPSNVCNMHFFNPAIIMKVVEIVKGPHTSQDTIAIAYDFVKTIGKEPVMLNKEIYGFLVNRVFSALTREACYLVDMGIATVEDIDKAVKGGLGHPMGPLELLDMTGIDLEYNIYMEKFRTSGNVADLPATCLAEKYSKGEYGRKTRKGFYEY